MTERIYYTDPACRAFEARVVGVLDREGRPAVVLDRTAFYPSSGGQPFDTGRLDAADVVETVDAGSEIVHVLSAPLPAGAHVHGTIDWARRADHMQQHTGQHVLSAAFDRLFGTPTISFHMGSELSTIDLPRELSAAEVERAVDEANEVVWSDRAVSIRFVSEEEAARLPLRKDPAREGTLRLIDIDGFDLSACGGTHVARTGEIGMIAVLGTERFKGGMRVRFACGKRALRALRTYRDAVAGTVRLLSVLPQELPGAVERLQAEAKDLRKTIVRFQESLASHEADRLLASAEEVQGRRVVVRALDGWDAGGLKMIGAALASHPGVAAALFSNPSPGAAPGAAGAGRPEGIAVVVVCSRIPTAEPRIPNPESRISNPEPRIPNPGLDASSILRSLTARFGGRGGGKPDLAQGGGLTGPLDEMQAAARALLLA